MLIILRVPIIFYCITRRENIFEPLVRGCRQLRRRFDETVCRTAAPPPTAGPRSDRGRSTVHEPSCNWRDKRLIFISSAECGGRVAGSSSRFARARNKRRDGKSSLIVRSPSLREATRPQRQDCASVGASPVRKTRKSEVWWSNDQRIWFFFL